MILTPDEIYDALMAGYQEDLVNYEQVVKVNPTLVLWLKKPEPPECLTPKPYTPGYMRSRKWKRLNR